MILHPTLAVDIRKGASSRKNAAPILFIDTPQNGVLGGGSPALLENGLKTVYDEMRLKNLNLTTLETRRIQGDLIEVYRIMNGIEGIDWKLLFSKAPYDGTKGHTMKLEKNVMYLDIRKYFFHKE